LSRLMQGNGLVASLHGEVGCIGLSGSAAVEGWPPVNSSDQRLKSQGSVGACGGLPWAWGNPIPQVLHSLNL
jgi:hypothetical protein